MKKTLSLLISAFLLVSCPGSNTQERQEEEASPSGEIHDSIKGGAWDAGAKDGEGNSAAGFQESNLND